MRNTFRAAVGATAVAVVAALATALPMGAAQAATTYTWVQGYDSNGDTIPGADHTSWSNPANWSPQGVPGAADSVVLTHAPAYHGVQSNTTLTVPTDTAVAGFAMSAPGAGSVHLTGAPLTVTSSFGWTGGEIETPTTLSSTAAGTIAAGTLKVLRHRLTVAGSLLLDDIGSDPDRGIDLYPDYAGDDDGIRVTKQGTLRARGTNLVSGTNCCTDPARVVVDGTADVTGGRTTFKAVELDLKGTTTVARAATLAGAVGPARLGANARYTGGGTVDFAETAAIDAQPRTAAVPGGVLMEGTGRLEDGTRLHLGIGAKLTGIGGFTGPGSVELSAAANPGNDAAHVYGDLSIGTATTLRVGGAVPSRLEVRSPDLAGYHGVLRIAGSAELARGATFVTQGGTATTVARGGTLRLAPGSTWGEGDCCLRPARLTNAGLLQVTTGAGAAARITWVDLRTTGTLALAAGKHLATAGYPVTLGGTLRTTDRVASGQQRTVLMARRVVGRFGCVQPAGQVATYSATAVRTTGVLGQATGCVGAAAGKRLAAKKVGKHRTLKIKATRGVGRKATKVLLAVTVTKVRSTTRIKVGGAPAFKAGKGRTTTRYVVATRKNRKFVTVRNGGKQPVKITVTLLGAA